MTAPMTPREALSLVPPRHKRCSRLDCLACDEHATVLTVLRRTIEQHEAARSVLRQLDEEMGDTEALEETKTERIFKLFAAALTKGNP